MRERLWIKFLLLLIGVAAIALSGTFVLRELMLSDFRAYLEGEAEDKIYLIQADMEAAYERQGGWKSNLQQQDAIRALMSGFKIQLTDREGKLIIDTDRAIAAASPLIRKRLEALTRFNINESHKPFEPYPLFLAGNKIGTLTVRELRPVREDLFLGRANRFMVLVILIVGTLALLLSILFARRLTRPIKELSRAAAAISRGEMQNRVASVGSDELGQLALSFNHMAQVLETQEMLRKKLIADVAHELRTPLAVMQGEIEGMQDGLLDTGPTRLQSLYEETGRLKKMVEAVEDLNKAEASRLSLQKQWIDIKAFLLDIAARYRTGFQAKGITLELVCTDSVRLHADPERLSQIVLNLLSNALRATDNGGTVTMRVARSGGSLDLTVEDTGSGIGEEDLPYIFERFYKGRGGGLGIGLTIVKELAEAHGARLEVKSTLGKGTTFALHFPEEAVHNVS